MNKFILNFFSLFFLSTSVVFTSCSDDDDDPASQKVNVRFEAAVATNGIIDTKNLEGMTVTFTEVRNSNATSSKLDASGIAEVALFKGTYDVSIEETAQEDGEEIVVALRIENISVNTEGQKIEGEVFSAPKQTIGQNFIFSEIFFNGETNSGKMMHPDQYIVIYNPTVETLYADGLCIATTEQRANSNKEMWYDEYYGKNLLPLGGFITIPGSGKEHAIAPGEKLVFAMTAVDHSKEEGYDHAVDLTGADWELYYGPETNDTDNAEVPNVLLTNPTDGSGFTLFPRGFWSPVMFKLENGMPETISAFVKENTSRTKRFIPADEEEGTPEAIIEIDILSIKNEKIIDGVQTGDERFGIITRVVPTSIDRGKFIVSGCHRQELAIRKTVEVNGKTFYKDTNNSDDDFVMQKGQNSFPKGWRNK